MILSAIARALPRPSHRLVAPTASHPQDRPQRRRHSHRMKPRQTPRSADVKVVAMPNLTFSIVDWTVPLVFLTLVHYSFRPFSPP